MSLAVPPSAKSHHSPFVCPLALNSVTYGFVFRPGPQTFSGPVRRRLGPRSWGEGSVREQDVPSPVPDVKVGSPTAEGGQKRGKPAGWEGRPAGLMQTGVSRIDEAEGGEEL